MGETVLRQWFKANSPTNPTEMRDNLIARESK